MSSPSLRGRVGESPLRAYLAPIAAGVGIAGGGVLYAIVGAEAADAVWAVTVAIMLVPLTASVLRSLLRGDLGVDVIALLAMAGALALGEYLAGAVIALMLAGGNALERFASARARRELTALVERAPHSARRRSRGGWEEIPIEQVQVGDTLLVRAGEIVPTDGALADEHAAIDESSLTGEPLPASYVRGQTIRSGTANAGDAFELQATRRASDSAYAALVRLVREAERRRAPFVRMADRYAVFFLPLTLSIAGCAWLVSGDAVRALAVLVVATPCPLILAAPIAFVAGLSRAARAGVIVKGGAAIERLGEARTVLLDKTGTLTLGVPGVERVLALDGVSRAELLRLAASLDQLSSHVLAAAIVRQAASESLGLVRPEQARESPGQGIEGVVEGRRVLVGSAAWLAANGIDPTVAPVEPSTKPLASEGARVLVALDQRLAGVLVMGDRIRPDARELVRRLRQAGIHHVAMVSGDRPDVARAVSERLGLDRVYSQQSPEEKLRVVRSMREVAGLTPVVMVGDGINDAPALAVADVGIAMGGVGATVSSETADAVITVDRIDRVADAIEIGRRTVHIAHESVLAGIGLSSIGMAFAAAGLLVPVAGALFQEAIDVAVILNALRALSGAHPS
ncbi:MAG TPA: heavy metal translocating P-type ATPase [Solirubrobacteraceae bacterium]|nr:heavy metal translocating P-type ATPase [Solirubrobacteraceae bacterium]